MRIRLSPDSLVEDVILLGNYYTPMLPYIKKKTTYDTVQKLEKRLKTIERIEMERRKQQKKEKNKSPKGRHAFKKRASSLTQEDKKRGKFHALSIPRVGKKKRNKHSSQEPVIPQIKTHSPGKSPRLGSMRKSDEYVVPVVV